MGKYSALPLPSDPLAVQQNNRALWNEARSSERADFFTFGYAGRTIEQIIGILRTIHVSTVVDIRYSPVSMYNPNFGKRNLRQRLARSRIGYIHLPELGVPRDIRVRAVQHGTREAIWAWYDANVLAQFTANLDRFFNLAEHPVALMCVEVDPAACHRHRLFLALEARGLRGFDL